MTTQRKNLRVVLGVTGSIAAYKAAELVRRIVTRGWEVRVIMTAAARRFVTELTFQTLSRNPVATDLFQEVTEWVPGHLSLAEWADRFVIAPCTANVMAKLAHGLADDLLTCTALATRAPILLAPAMNEAMWLHPATRDNVRILRRRGVHVLEVARGELACGREGRGRMAEPETILEALASRITRRT